MLTLGTNIMKKLLLIISIALLSLSHANASDIQIQQSTLYPYRSMIEAQDEFMTGSSTSGTIGSLGWAFGAGTVSYVNNEAANPGVMRRLTGVGFPVTAFTFLNLTNQVIVAPTLSTDALFVVRPSHTNTDIQYRIGVAFLLNANPTNGFYFEKLFADTNIFCVTINASVATRTDSGIAASANFSTFQVSKSSSGVQFRINNSLVCSHTTNIPTSQLLTIGHQVSNQNATDVGIDTDYIQYRITGLTR